MKKRLVVANWKMNPKTQKEAILLFKGIIKKTSRIDTVDVVICPPFIYLEKLINSYKGKKISFGAQDISENNPTGPYTGEISANMIKNTGAKYVILGHSERRRAGETNKVVSKKTRIALEEKMTPIVCIGEAKRDKDGGHFKFLSKQLKDSLAGVKKQDVKKVVVAYEPIWAIGKNAKDAITKDMLHQTIIFIRKTLVENFSRAVGMSVKLLYGGSVESGNDDTLMDTGVIDGFLVGHASLNSVDFLGVVNSK